MEKIKTFHYHSAAIGVTSLSKETLICAKLLAEGLTLELGTQNLDLWRYQQAGGIQEEVKTGRQGRATCTRKASTGVFSGMWGAESSSN